MCPGKLVTASCYRRHAMRKKGLLMTDLWVNTPWCRDVVVMDQRRQLGHPPVLITVNTSDFTPPSFYFKSPPFSNFIFCIFLGMRTATVSGVICIRSTLLDHPLWARVIHQAQRRIIMLINRRLIMPQSKKSSLYTHFKSNITLPYQFTPPASIEIPPDGPFIEFRDLWIYWTVVWTLDIDQSQSRHLFRAYGSVAEYVKKYNPQGIWNLDMSDFNEIGTVDAAH